MFHVSNIGMAPLVSSAMGLPNISVEVGEEDNEIDALSGAIESLDVDAIVTGAIASDYQAFRINMICESLGVKVFSPLWHKDEEMLLREMSHAGFHIVVVGVFAEGIGPDWLGRELDSKAIDELVQLSRAEGIHVSGEGGEIETIAIDGPNFGKALEIVSSQIAWKKDSGILRIHAMKLSDKR